MMTKKSNKFSPTIFLQKPIIKLIFNPTDDEKNALKELRRRASQTLEKEIGDLDLLVNCQHFGMRTRLLDWSTNPLTSLYFACENNDDTYPSFFIFYHYQKKVT